VRPDVTPVGAELYFIAIETRVPFKFGRETLTSVVCARVRVTVADRAGRRADGWGEVPLNVQWAWPSSLRYQERNEAMQAFCRLLSQAWVTVKEYGHPVELGYYFSESKLGELLERHNQERGGGAEAMPCLAALVCCSAFDIAVHDAYGRLVERDVYGTYNGEFMNHDLAYFLEPADGTGVSFAGRYPADFLRPRRCERVPVWHLVGGKDPVDGSDLTGDEPDDGYPVLLTDWVARDGLKCLKVKLCGTDSDWDYERLVRVGKTGIENGVVWLSADFNCTVSECGYVNEILDRLMAEEPRIFQMILYVEQPFAYDLEVNRIDVRSVSARKPLFMDESAHDWRLIRLGRSLGWTSVALKTCKTQSGALLSLCWARAHGMTLMVQDLSNPMLAQIPHVLLAAHSPTIMGVETNGMQFYPAASGPEEAVHPGLFRRRNGMLDLSTVRGAGFGYRVDEIKREPGALAAWFEK